MTVLVRVGIFRRWSLGSRCHPAPGLGEGQSQLKRWIHCGLAGHLTACQRSWPFRWPWSLPSPKETVPPGSLCSYPIPASSQSSISPSAPPSLSILLCPRLKILNAPSMLSGTPWCYLMMIYNLIPIPYVWTPIPTLSWQDS